MFTWFPWVLLAGFVTYNVTGWFIRDEAAGEAEEVSDELKRLADTIYELRTEISELQQRLAPLSEEDQAQIRKHIECLTVILNHRIVSDDEADEDALAFAITNLSMLVEKPVNDVA